MTEESLACHSELAEKLRQQIFRHPELVSGSHETNAKEEILNSVLSTSKPNDPCFRMTRCACKKKAAFTLAETLIVLVILGVVAAITIPALVRNQMEAQNRTRIKKAMTVYDMLINKIVVENNIKDDVAVQNWANANGPCVNSSNYFKVAENVVENGNPNTCKFKTNDGVWWDITNILNPTIGLREADLDENANSDTRFKLLSHFDQNGSLRVDDLAYEQAQENNTENINMVGKIYAFINNEKFQEKDSSYDYLQSQIQKYLNGDFDKMCENINGNGFGCTSCVACSFCTKGYGNYIDCKEGGSPYIFDENGNTFASRYGDRIQIQTNHTKTSDGFTFFDCDINDLNDLTKCAEMSWHNEHIYGESCEPYDKYSCQGYITENNEGIKELENNNIICTENHSSCMDWNENGECIKEIQEWWGCKKKK